MKINIIFFIASLLTTTYGNAASFDCALASSRIDNEICASPQLSKLDSDLDAAYKIALSKKSDPNAVKLSQRAWLKETRNACLDEACMSTVYKQRIAALSNDNSSPVVASGVSTEGSASVPAVDVETQKSKTGVEEKLDGDINAEEHVKKIAEQAAVAADAAVQAQKVAQQNVALAAKELTDKAEAEAKHSAEQQRQYLTVAAEGAGVIALAIVGWFGFRLLWRNISPRMKSFDRYKANQALYSAKERATSASPALKGRALEASKKLEEDLEHIKIARKLQSEETIKNESQPDTTTGEINSNQLNSSPVINPYINKLFHFWDLVKANPIKSTIAALIILGAIGGKDRNYSTSSSTQDPTVLLQSTVDSLQKVHDSICNTPLSTQVQRCVTKNRDRTDATAWCVNVLMQAKQEEGCR